MGKMVRVDIEEIEKIEGRLQYAFDCAVTSASLTPHGWYYLCRNIERSLKMLSELKSTEDRD